MPVYLIKVSLIWLVFYLLYLIIYKRSQHFTANRIYLILALISGLSLPLIPWHLPEDTARVVQAVPRVWSDIQIPLAEATARPRFGQRSWQGENLWYGLYLLGVLTLLGRNLKELTVILKAAVNGQGQALNGQQVFFHNKRLPPFSFIRWTFISKQARYEPEELAFILQHEHAHNRRRHWIDLWLIQLVCCLFWFNPLVWLFRYQLRLVHEYEADQYAASGKVQQYGTFLLRETLLQGAPAITHSFHFSPLKNRIAMLTRKTTITGWSYLLVIPLLLGCGLLMAQTTTSGDRIRNGDQVVFKGKTFTWMERPSVKQVFYTSFDRSDYYVDDMPQQPVIHRMDGDSVYLNDRVSLPAQFRHGTEGFYAFANREFRERVKEMPDDIYDIQINNLVLDKAGNVVYYELLYQMTDTTLSSIRELDPIVTDIVENSPHWLPAVTFHGQSVPVFMEIGGGIRIKERSFKARPLTKEEIEARKKEAQK